MNSIRGAVLCAMALSCLVGRSANCDNGKESWSVTFIDKGPVIPNPVVFTVSIGPDSISYSKTQSGSVVEKWSKKIRFSDYSSLRKVIVDNKLYQSGDMVPPGPPGCMGSRGMTIKIKKEGNVHSFDIDGGVYCDKSQWPDGVRKLVDLEEVLIKRYQ